MPEPIDLADLKAFARVDADDHDVLLADLAVAAREFVEQATGRTFTDTDTPERAKLAIKALATCWYDNDVPVENGPSVPVPFHVRSLIQQLRGGVLEPIDIDDETDAEP